VVEQLGSTFDSLESNEEQEENLEVVNIPKKSIQVLKWIEESKNPKRLWKLKKFK
jgi:hypothetical protein